MIQTAEIPELVLAFTSQNNEYLILQSGQATLNICNIRAARLLMSRVLIMQRALRP